MILSLLLTLTPSNCSLERRRGSNLNKTIGLTLCPRSSLHIEIISVFLNSSSIKGVKNENI